MLSGTITLSAIARVRESSITTHMYRLKEYLHRKRWLGSHHSAESEEDAAALYATAAYSVENALR